MDAVINPFYIDPQHAIEIGFGRALRIPDMRDAGVINKNVDSVAAKNFRESRHDLSLIPYIAAIGGCGSSGAGNLGRDCLGVFRTDIKNVDCCAIGCELVRNGAANSAPAASDDCSFPIQAEFARTAIYGQSETPRFQGMKSS
jgi:hypothetical protein